MRIGMVADTYKPHISGVTNYISINKKILEQWGHEVFVFTFGDSDKVDDEVNIVRSPGMPLVDTGFYVSFRYSREAKALLQTMDVLHVHHPFQSGQIILRYAKPFNIPIVFTNHTRYDLYLHSYLPLLPDGLGAAFLQAYLPSFCREVDLVISPSQGMEAVLRKLGVDVPIEVIPNGVDLAVFQAPVEPCQRADYNFDDKDILLIFVGRLAPEKNLSFLLRSFAGLNQTYPNTKLILVGVGSEQDDLKDLAKLLRIQDAVLFTGLVPYLELPQYLKMCDAFVTPSVTEVHPLSVIEAMAAGLPVLGITSPGVGDTVKDSFTGLLSSPDISSFTAKMALLVTDHELRKKMGVQARLESEQYAIERTSQFVLEKYELLTQQAKGKQRGVRFRVRTFVEKWRW